MSRIAEVLAAAIRAIIPQAKSDWAAAMIAEAAEQNDEEATNWFFGCLIGAVMARLHDAAMVCSTIFIALSVILFFEWHTDEPLIVLPVLLLVACGAGAILPKRFLMVGLVTGLAIVCAHALSGVSGLMVPRYQQHKPLPGDWLAMTLLLLPSVAAAFVGSRLARIFAH
jgi:hypothetical protein